MSRLAWIDARAIVAGLAITAAAASLGAAVDVRDRVGKCEAGFDKGAAVKAVEDKAMQEWRDEVRGDLRAIKARLGVQP